MRPISVADALARWYDIDRADSAVGLRSVIALDPEAVARTARRSDGSGPLEGVPVLVKDNIEAEGLPCTAGSLALRDVPVPGDSPIAARLRRAGAVIIGSANLSEWANIRSTRSSSGWSAVGGLVANPWALDRSAGQPRPVGRHPSTRRPVPETSSGCAAISMAIALVGGPRSEHVLIAAASAVERSLGLVHDPEWGPRFMQPARG